MFAFVDGPSWELIVNADKFTRLLRNNTNKPRLGVWRLLRVGKQGLPFASSRRNSRIPKMLPHRLFPLTRFFVWIDAKLELRVLPSVLVDTYLVQPRRLLAVLPHWVRKTLDEERDGILGYKCGGKIDGGPLCRQIARQWNTYEMEQTDLAWIRNTVDIEGSMLLYDARSPVLQLLLCNWFNEYMRFSERDQLCFPYVLMRMGLTHPDGTSSAINYIDKKHHYWHRVVDKSYPIDLMLSTWHPHHDRLTMGYFFRHELPHFIARGRTWIGHHDENRLAD